MGETTKRREICQFFRRNATELRSRFRFMMSKGLYDWISNTHVGDAKEAEFAELYREIGAWALTPTKFRGQAGGVVELANDRSGTA